MPEGDTIWRLAERLRPALEGKVVASFEAMRLVEPGPRPGTAIGAVEAEGKVLLIHFGDGTTLETHMKMTGSWHLYREGERWRRSPRAARAVVTTTEGWTAVCFAAPHVALVATSDRRSHLGPDLTAPNPDLEAALERFELVDGATPIAEVLLDQRVFAGVGNVYKSEVLHAVSLDPRTAVADVGVERRRMLLSVAHRLLRANLGPGPRTTVPSGLAVYRRAGEPCGRCGHVVERFVEGRHTRSTYWCRGCQLPPGETSPEL